LWRESTEEPLKEYQLTVVTYGMASSGYNAVKAMRQCAIDHEQSFPIGAMAIQNKFYMDDLLSSVNTIEEAIEEQSEMAKVLAKGGFELAKWSSNAKEIVGITQDTETPLDKDATSVLGLNWLAATDMIKIKIRITEIDGEITKRSIASQGAQFYDPIGIASPVTNEAKKFMKNLWRIGVGWDEPVTAEIAEQWKAYYYSLAKLSELRIPRWLGISPAGNTQLHVFCDASTSAYGAVIYTRVTNDDGSIKTNLITSKGKLSSLKSITIPRLELTAAQMGAKLAQRIALILSIPTNAIHYWVDS
jgi:hypothetical protein